MIVLYKKAMSLLKQYGKQILPLLITKHIIKKGNYTNSRDKNTYS